MKVQENRASGTLTEANAASMMPESLLNSILGIKPDEAKATKPQATKEPVSAKRAEPESAETDDGQSSADEFEDPTDEAEGSDENASDENLDEAEEDQEVEEPAEADDFIEIVVAGQPAKVTLDELKKGYERQADYTRKTTALAEKSKNVESEATKLAELRGHYEQNLMVLAAELAPSRSPEDYMRILEEQGVEEYTRAKIEDERKRVRFDKYQQEYAKVQRERAQEMVAKGKSVLAEKMPELTTKEGAEKLAHYLLSAGFNQAEVSSVYDHRQAIIAEKARRWDEMQSKASKKLEQVRQAPKVSKGNDARQTKTERAEVHKAKLKKQMSKPMKSKDAVDLLLKAGFIK